MNFRDVWDFNFMSFPFEECVPAEVLVQVLVLAKPPTSIKRQKPGPDVPANGDDPWSDEDKERHVHRPRA